MPPTGLSHRPGSSAHRVVKTTSVTSAVPRHRPVRGVTRQECVRSLFLPTAQLAIRRRRLSCSYPAPPSGPNSSASSASESQAASLGAQQSGSITENSQMLDHGPGSRLWDGEPGGQLSDRGGRCPSPPGELQDVMDVGGDEAGEVTLAGGRCRALCAVCRDEASGHFFGANVCLPCKSFFIRCNRAGPYSIAKQCRGACDVTKQLRNRCQYCRLQRCLVSGMARKDKPEVVKASLGQELCRVCGDLANGLHFGVFTCEGCKKFFRRALKEHESYVCRVGGGCPVNPRTRNQCRHCRYRRCLNTGMSRTAIKMGRPRKFPNRSASDAEGLNRATLSNDMKERTAQSMDESFIGPQTSLSLDPEDATHQTEGPLSAAWADPVAASMASLGHTMSHFLESVSDYSSLFDTVTKAELEQNHGTCVRRTEGSRNESSANAVKVLVGFPSGPRNMPHAGDEAIVMAAAKPINKQLSNQTRACFCGDDFPANPCDVIMKRLDLRKAELCGLSSKSVFHKCNNHFQVTMSPDFGPYIKDSSEFRQNQRDEIDCSFSGIEKRSQSKQRWSGTATLNESCRRDSPCPPTSVILGHAKNLNQAARDVVSFAEAEGSLSDKNTVSVNAFKPEQIPANISSSFTPTEPIILGCTNSRGTTSSYKLQAEKLKLNCHEYVGVCEYASSRSVTDEDCFAVRGTTSASSSDPQHKLSADSRVEANRRQRKCLASKQGGVPLETESTGVDSTQAEAGESKQKFVLSCGILSSDDSSTAHCHNQRSAVLDQNDDGNIESPDKGKDDAVTAFPPTVDSVLTGSQANDAEALNYSPFTRQEEMRQTSDHFCSLDLLLEQAEDAVDETLWKTHVFSETPCEAHLAEELMSRHYNFSPVSIVSYWTQLADSLPATLSFGTTMPSRYRTVLDSILRAYQDVISVMDHSKYEPKAHEGALLWPDNGLELKRVWAIVQNRIIRGVAASMACAYLVPGMERVHPNDRTQLVSKEFCFAMAILNSTLYFDCQRGQFRNFFTFDMSNIPPVNAFRARLLHLGRKISMAAPDTAELGLLFALNTFCLETDGFEDEASLLAVRQDLLMTLASYLTCERKVEPRQRMRSLFRMIPRLRVIGRWYCHLTRNMVFDSSLLNLRMRTLQLHMPTDSAQHSAVCPPDTCQINRPPCCVCEEMEGVGGGG